MFEQDFLNNLGRLCSLGDGAGRVWRVVGTLPGGDYWLVNVRTGGGDRASLSQMSNLY